MKRVLVLLLLLGSVAGICFGQSYQTGYVYVGPTASVPTACVVGQLAFYTDATAGKNVYACTTTGSPGTWTLQGNGTASGTVSGQANGVIPLATASTTIGAQSALSDNGSLLSLSEPMLFPGSNTFQAIPNDSTNTGFSFGYQNLASNSNTGGNPNGNGNFAIGYQALSSNTTGYYNMGIGYRAGYLNTTGIENTYAGYGAGWTNSTGASNTGFGFQALDDATGSDNTAVGADSQQNTNGGASYNTSVGAYAMAQNLGGASNTAIGEYASQANTTGNFNTAIGANALATNLSSDQTAIGYYALQAATGSPNLAIGFEAGLTITSAVNNTAIGYRVMGAGAAALTGTGENTAVGDSSMNAAQGTAEYDTAIGGLSFYSLTTGIENTAMGYYAGGLLTNGANNTFVGFEAGGATVGSSNSTFIGSQTTSSTDASNMIVIGYQASASAANQTVIGKSTVNSFIPYGTISVESTAPGVSSNAGSGSLSHGTDNSGIITTGAASTASTLTFANGWGTWASCTVSASTATAQPYVSAISNSAVTFTYVTTGTPQLYYMCFGQ